LIPFKDGNLVKEITPEGYVEGPVMFMSKKKLYFMWLEGNWGFSVPQNEKTIKFQY
jgi:hypothetical protein